MNNRNHERTLIALARLGIGYDDARALCRAERTLHAWAEHECNGAIQRDEVTDRPYWHSTHDGRRLGRTSDRERGARDRAARILAAYDGLVPYFQTDPRGCALYVSRDPLTDTDYTKGVAACTE